MSRPLFASEGSAKCFLRMETLVFSGGDGIKMSIFSHVLQFGEIVNWCVASKNRRHVIWENSCLQNTVVSQRLFYFFLLGLLGCPGPYYCIAKVLMKTVW